MVDVESVSVVESDGESVIFAGPVCHANPGLGLGLYHHFDDEKVLYHHVDDHHVDDHHAE